MSPNVLELVALPYGEAGRVIRRTIDPLWGISPGVARTWFVDVTTWGCDCREHSKCCEYGRDSKTYTIEASSPKDAAEEAERLAARDKLGEVDEVEVCAEEDGPPIDIEAWEAAHEPR